jgi:uncharacterized protein (TIGR03435 family)
LVSTAYDLPPYQVDFRCELPDERYDATVVMPPGSEAECAPALQRAIAMTFGLRMWRETVTRDVYVLTTARMGTKLIPTVMASGGGSYTSSGELSLANAPLETVARHLGDYLERPVRDETGLDGRYDVNLRWNHEQEDALVTAVCEQLGLELIPVRRPVEILVVEKTKEE